MGQADGGQAQRGASALDAPWGVAPSSRCLARHIVSRIAAKAEPERAAPQPAISARSQRQGDDRVYSDPAAESGATLTAPRFMRQGR